MQTFGLPLLKRKGLASRNCPSCESQVRTRQCLGASSLAWSILALHAWRETPALAGEIVQRVAQIERLLHSPERIADNSTLAVSALALDAVTSDRNPFEVRR